MMAAQIFLRKGQMDGKRGAASYFKSHCHRESGLQQLNELLDTILDPTKPINDWETIDWCRWLMAGGQTPDDFAKTVRLYDNATTCGLVWTSNFVAYRCRTCGISLYMSLCADCFRAGNHEGHDYNMFRSQAGGACDCGDPSVMKEEGFCPRHGPSKDDNSPCIPEDLLGVAEAMMPRITLRLVQYLRAQHAKADDLDSHLIAIKDVEVFLTFLHTLSDMGAAMQRKLIHALINPLIYKNLTEETNPYMKESQAQFSAVVASMVKPVFVIGIDFQDKLEYKTFLDELTLWTVKYEFPQKLVTLLLNMLTENDYKEAFTRTFVQHYTRISLALANSKQSNTLSNRVVHVSVQLFSNEQLALKMAEENHLITTMLISLTHMVMNALVNDSDESSFDQTVNCAEKVMKEHCYWPLVSDLINVLSHKAVSFLFMSDAKLLEMWFELVTYFQAMNMNQRERVHHVEYEPNTYYASFSAELEACSSPLWVLAGHLRTPDTLHYTKALLEKCMSALLNWFDAINIRSLDSSCKLSFHLPLHRWYALFISHAVQFQGATLEELLPSGSDLDEVLWDLMIHPLQIQVSFYEIFASMWVRNGLQIKGQAMTYVQCHFCNSLVDPDIFMLQVCACKLDPDKYLSKVIEKFHTEDWLAFRKERSKNAFLEKEKDLPLMEGMLTFLAQLLTIRLHLGS
ncbi:PREDICTED: E3 ubiquitin-protein ligase UBR3-like [Priapulus caudatus]|uniref:E3 ubiquitin-protein ligase n=1 Tax=Priapulus caudatus TaxID=37621 RepID=A0ABM1E9D2_PRICU|nr:PREDICTED: E3 ubiquitin-protein ligase UBR3-like [Priapulus caudatus]